MVILKTKKELDKMKDSGYIVGDVLNELKHSIKPGVTTKYLNNKAESIIRQHKAIPAFLGYKGFPFVICASINEEVIHGFASDRKLVEGDIISIDVGVNYKGWFGDAAITIPVGKVSDIAGKLVNTARACLYMGVDAAVPEGRLGDISNTIQTHAEAYGFSVIRDYVGHGIGRNLHEDPQVKNYGNAGEGLLLKAGMVLAIEPMVMEKNYKTKKLRNNWTVVTKDEGLAAHFEHTVAITEEGPQILTKI